jgi:signal transduction histidine kinase
VQLLQEGRSAAIHVRDQGCGIAKEIQDRIFNLYFTTKRDGTGIGLAMTYRILQLHNGSIAIESVVGQGTEFVLRVPLGTSKEAPREASATSSGNLPLTPAGTV